MDRFTHDGTRGALPTMKVFSARRWAPWAVAAAVAAAAAPAWASPTLMITNNPTGAAAAQEVAGDPGGTSAAGGGTTAGIGIPTALGGWPATGAFAADPSFGGALGITGYHTSLLYLTEAATVTFQFLGRGNANLVNVFQVFRGGSWQTLFTGGTTNSCSLIDPFAGAYGCTLGYNEFHEDFGAGYIAFRYLVGDSASTVLTNGTAAGAAGFNPDPVGSASFVLGADPYFTNSKFARSGRAVFAGLSDLPDPGDHDFQDLGVRISVPEPGSLALVAVALTGLGLAGRRRRT